MIANLEYIAILLAEILVFITVLLTDSSYFQTVENANAKFKTIIKQPIKYPVIAYIFTLVLYCKYFLQFIKYYLLLYNNIYILAHSKYKSIYYT